MWKRSCAGLVKLVCAVLLLGWAFTRVEAESWERFTVWYLKSGWGAAGLGFGFLSVLGWAGRWFLLLRGIGIGVSFFKVLRLTMVADFFNLYFLGPIGADGVRFAAMCRGSGGSKRAELAVILILDHLLGLQALAVTFILLTFPQWHWLQHHADPRLGQAATISAAFVLAVGIASGGIFWPIGIRIMICLLRLFKRWPMVRQRGEEILVTVGGGMRRSLITAQVVAVFSLFCAYGGFWCAAEAVNAPVPTGQLFALLPVVDTVASLPVFVSGLGIREQFFSVAFAGDSTAGASIVVTSLLGFSFLGLWGIVGGLMILEGVVAKKNCQLL
jgi:glycosyltransferase 2 family protein